MMLVFDNKTQHSGAVNLVAGNTSIYFLGPTALFSGVITDLSTGNIYWNCTVASVYNKTASTTGTTP